MTTTSPSRAALQALLSRYSQGIKYLSEPGPDEAALQAMVQAALRAPDHGELRPWRLCAVRGAARERLADLFCAHARAKGKGEDALAIERERALKAPLTVAVVARIDLGHPQVPAHEQWMCVGGAVTNFLNAVHAQGFAAKMLSGDKARSAQITRAFCGPGETLVGWIAVGTPTRSGGGRERQAPETPVLTDWTG